MSSDFHQSKLHSKKLPLELFLLVGGIILMFSMIAFLGRNNPDLQVQFWLKVSIGIFLISFVIGALAVVTGVGGSIFITPILLAFTSIDTLFVRGCGIIVSMFGGLIAIRYLFRSNILNLNILFYCAIPIVTGSLLGSWSAVFVSDTYAAQGDAWLRLILGILMLVVSVLMLLSRSQDFPEVKKKSQISTALDLHGSYTRRVNSKVIHYSMSRPILGLFLLLGIGFMTGFYGIGGGWAMIPVLNLIMSLPIKIVVSTGGVLAGFGTTAAFWGYVTEGAILPFFAVPLMLGQIVGGITGSLLLASFRAEYIRYLLVIMIAGLGARLLYVAFNAI